MKFLNCLFTVIVLLIPSSVLSQDILLESPRVTNWGGWGERQLCPQFTFVYGMRLKVQSDQGTFGDDTALNAIELFCISPHGKRNISAEINPLQGFTTIKSSEGHKGDWGVILECPNPGFGVGFQLRSESDQGWFEDDTAANNLRLFCSTGETLEGQGRGWGSWTDERRCPRGTQLCGLQTQVEAPQDDDDSTLNNVNMGCCAIP